MIEKIDEGCIKHYLLALESAYNVIFSVSLKTRLVKCIYGKHTSPIGEIFDVQMTIESAIVYWCDNYILPEYRDMMRAYFNNIGTPGYLIEQERALQAEFTLALHSGEQYRYLGVSVPVNEDELLFCCRDISHLLYTPNNVNGERDNHVIQIRTFGFFDVFVDGKAIVFTNPKEKELLALLVDRNGGTLSSKEAISILWEDEPLSEKLMSRYRKLAMRLKETLKENDIDYIMTSEHGVRSLNLEKVQCDYADLLKGDPKAKNAFNDTYMSNYSWSEETLNSLLVLTEDK